ncbi:MAG TPA: knotted carbamoyltransferase YgeW [Phycicoccus sp.]
MTGATSGGRAVDPRLGGITRTGRATDFASAVGRLDGLDHRSLHHTDLLRTWDATDDGVRVVLAVADALRALREANRSPRVFDSGLGVSIFHDNSTRTRFSFASACNLLGLSVQDFDEGSSQVAHGETVRETATMISFMADVVGIRDDLYVGHGHRFITEFAQFLTESHDEGALAQRPTVVNLQSDVDHPTQAFADLLHLVHRFGGIEELRGRRLAMTWAHSPSYGKPLSVPQGMVALMARLGMDVVLAHPPGYGLLDEPLAAAARGAERSGGSFTVTDSLEEAFDGADVVCAKSWAPFGPMLERAALHERGDTAGIRDLERAMLEQNAEHRDWTVTTDLMRTTRDGAGLYLHPLPADITGIGCDAGEVDAEVFDRHRTSLYDQAGNKPYAIAAMVFLSRVDDPVAQLNDLWDRGVPRRT